VPAEVAADKLDLVVVDLAVYGVRVGRGAVGPEERGLYGVGAVHGGEAVEHVAVVGLVDPDREPLRREGLDPSPGRNQNRIWRVTSSGSPRSESNSPAHAPAATTRRPAS
jgi:hypothetical protein